MGQLAQCSAATNHLITNAVLNISSDIMIILIPMPLLLQSQLPAKRKAVLGAVFALGSFTVRTLISWNEHDSYSCHISGLSCLWSRRPWLTHVIDPFCHSQ